MYQPNLLKMGIYKMNREEAIKYSEILLNLLIIILKTYNGFLFLPEIQFLKEFSQTEVIPLTTCQPRMIIESMMKIHAECTTAILKNPDYLTKLVYKYNSGEKEEEYVFSNNMPFYIDVITICFLHTMALTEFDYVHPVIKDLITIMRNKYRLSCTNNCDPLVITETDVAISYPSVSVPLYYYNNIFNPNLHIIFHITNINFGLPWCAWLALIIPVIESEFKTPLALLLAIAVICDTDQPSYVLYQRILTFYTSEVFPRRFKLDICTCLGFIYKEGNKYRFASYFTKHREKAIRIISSSKNDTSVKYTLSLI